MPDKSRAYAANQSRCEGIRDSDILARRPFAGEAGKPVSQGAFGR